MSIKGLMNKLMINSQTAITCSKLTIEILELGVKYVNNKVSNKDSRTTPMA